jgi:hypothetical protein
MTKYHFGYYNKKRWEKTRLQSDVCLLKENIFGQKSERKREKKTMS